MKKSIALLVLISTLLFTIPTGEALADGSDVLGPPSIAIASGTGIVAAGTGLLSQPGSIDLSVPAGATVKQVLLYWEGIGTPDNTIEVNSTEVAGTEIGVGFDDGIHLPRTCFRTDITSRGWVGPGSNSLSVDGLNFGSVNDGAGVLVIIDDGSGAAEIEVRDGCDFAYWKADSPYDTTVPQVFTFDPADFDRTATLDMFFSSVSGTASGGGFRPTAIVTVDGVTTVYNDLLDSNDGEEWDTVTLSVPIPADAVMLTVQALSVDNPDGEDGDPASFTWITAALSIPPTPPEGCTPGYWKQDQHFDSWEGYLPDDDFEDEDVFGCSITIKWSERGKPQEVTNPTLLQALQANGGGESALARHAVAALLNAANPDVNYPRNEDQVKTMVCDALSGGDIEETKNTLAGWNEEFCPLDDETPPSVEHTNTNTGPLRSYDITCKDKKSGLAEINVTGSRNFKVDIPPFTAGTNDSTIVTATKTNQSEESFVELEVIDVAGNVTYYDPEVNSASEEQKSSGGGGGGGCFIATAADG
jgi:hypothetical protein